MKTNASLTTPDLFGIAVRPVVKDGDIWFVGKDICDALCIRNHNDALSRLDADEKGVGNADTLGGMQNAVIVNESGMYHLVFNSRNPVAKAFRRWVTLEVLPAIRKTGFYAAPGYAAGEDALAHVRLRVRDYFALRGITGSTAGFGHTCTAICRRSGIEYGRVKWKGSRFPVEVLDRAAGRRPAERGPLLPDGVPDAFVFLRDRSLQKPVDNIPGETV